MVKESKPPVDLEAISHWIYNQPLDRLLLLESKLKLNSNRSLIALNEAMSTSLIEFGSPFE